jgi:hypothetical protein
VSYEAFYGGFFKKICGVAQFSFQNTFSFFHHKAQVSLFELALRSKGCNLEPGQMNFFERHILQGKYHLE